MYVFLLNLFFISGIVSIMTLCTLAYERYIRVVHAKVIDLSWAWRAVTHIWLYSLAWTGAPLLGWNRYTLEIHQLGCSLNWASKDPNDASFILFFLLACYFVPVGIMAYCYGNILYTVHMVRKKHNVGLLFAFILTWLLNLFMCSIMCTPFSHEFYIKHRGIHVNGAVNNNILDYCVLLQHSF